MRRTYYRNHVRYVRIAGTYSPPLQYANGHLQGSSWSLDDIKLLARAWDNGENRHAPRSISTTLVDDSYSTAPAAAELGLALQETAHFDRLSG